MPPAAWAPRTSSREFRARGGPEASLSPPSQRLRVKYRYRALCAKLSRRTLRVASGGGGKALLCHRACLRPCAHQRLRRRVSGCRRGGSTSVGLDLLDCAGNSQGCEKNAKLKMRQWYTTDDTCGPRVARARPHSAHRRPMSGVKAALDKLSEPLRGGATGCALGLGRL